MLRENSKRYTQGVVRRIPFTWLRKLSTTPIVAPLYHLVSDETNQLTKNLFLHRGVQQFRDDIDFFKKHFNPIDLDQIVEHVRHGAVLPPKSFFLSFDDGMREIHDIVAPILSDAKVPATFFLCPDLIDNHEMMYRNKASLVIDWIQQSPGFPNATRDLFRENDLVTEDVVGSIKSIRYRSRNLFDLIAESLGKSIKGFLEEREPYVTTQQVRDLLSAGFRVGAHSMNHPRYAELEVAEQLQQTRDSVRSLSDRFAFDCNAFAFPFSEVGVPQKFFDEVMKDEVYTAVFGTRGIVKDKIPNLFQRFSVEAHPPERDIGKALVEEYARAASQVFDKAPTDR